MSNSRRLSFEGDGPKMQGFRVQDSGEPDGHENGTQNGNWDHLQLRALEFRSSLGGAGELK